MFSLYEIDQRILALADEDTGEITDFETFEALQIEREQKIESVALWYKNLIAEAEMIKTEADKLTERRKACEAKAEQLKKHVELALSGNKFVTPKVVCSFKASESVEINDLSKLPMNYLRFTEPSADKNAIKTAIKQGKEIDGAMLVRKLNLNIK